MRPLPATLAAFTLAMACGKDRAVEDVPSVPSVAIGISLTASDASVDGDEAEQAYLRALAAQRAQIADVAVAEPDAPVAPPVENTARPGDGGGLNVAISIDLAALLAQPADASAPADAAAPEPVVAAPDPALAAPAAAAAPPPSSGTSRPGSSWGCTDS